MKILELLEAEFETRQTQKQFTKSFDDAKDIRNLENSTKASIGTGRYGRVYNTNDPHTIIKRNHFAANPDRDGYYLYATEIIKSGIAKTNPYFPRFYNIKTFKDKSGHIKYRFEMERLHTAKEVGDEIIYAITEQLFGEEAIKKFDSKYFGSNTVSRLSEMMEIYLFTKTPNVSDEKFMEAINFIRENVIKKYNLRSDLHSENIMFRLSPYPQVVITDPVQ